MQYQAAIPSCTASTCEGDNTDVDSPWGQVCSGSEGDTRPPAAKASASPSPQAPVSVYVPGSKLLSVSAGGKEAAVGAERDKRPSTLRWLDMDVQEDQPLHITAGCGPVAKASTSPSANDSDALRPNSGPLPPGVWGPPGAAPCSSLAIASAWDAHRYQQHATPPPPPYPAPQVDLYSDQYGDSSWTAACQPGFQQPASPADAVAIWQRAELAAAQARAEADARTQVVANLQLQVQAQQAVQAANQAAQAAAYAQSLVAQAQANLHATLSRMGVPAGVAYPSRAVLPGVVSGAGSGQLPWAPPGALGPMAPPASFLAPEAHDTRTMREHLQQLKSVDHRLVLRVRKIHTLGFQSPSILRAHFERYGKVDSVLVAHSHVRSSFLPSGAKKREATTRLRPAHLGFVVMGSAEAAATAIADPGCVTVAGLPISVERFERRCDEGVMDEDEYNYPDDA